MQNVHGISLNRLVFGKNPNYPRVLIDNLSVLDGRTSSQIRAGDVNAMHAARKTIVKSEKVRGAFRSKFRSSGDTKYFTGNTVY